MSGWGLLFDTGIVIALARADDLGRAVVDHFSLRERPQKPFVSIVSAGECLAIARRDKWGPARVEALKALLSNFSLVDIAAEGVLDQYATIASHLELSGKQINQNDMWIAACAAAADARLVTTDGDFDRLVPEFVARTRFEPRTGRLLSE